MARPFVLYSAGWGYPYKAYWFGRGDGLGDHVRYAESKDGVNWENNQPLDLEDALAGGTTSSPDGHAVLYDPGSSVAPYVMLLNSNDPTSGPLVNLLKSQDGLKWEWHEFAIFDQGYQVSAIVKIADNDYRAWGFAAYNVPGIQSFRSTDGVSFELVEDPVSNVGDAGSAGPWNQHRNYQPSVVYRGNGQFYMWRSGKNDDSGNYRTGFAVGVDADLVTFVGEWTLFD